MLTKNNRIVTIFFYLSWITLIFSINAKPHEIINFGKNTIQSINALRILIPYCLSLIFLFYSLYFYFKKKIYINNLLIIYILFAYFFFQIIGLIQNKNVAISDIYLPILGIGTLSFLFISIYNFKLSLNIFLNLLIGIIAATSITLLIIFLIINDNRTINLYYLINPTKEFLYEATPRITGLSRMIALVNLYLISIFVFKNLSKIMKILCFTFITALSITIILSQSRGTLICYFPSTLILISLSNDNLKKKICSVIILIAFPMLLYICILNQNKIFNLIKINFNRNFIEENISTKESTSFIEILKTKTRYLLNNDSGRLILWEYVIKKYEYNKIFGYGPQADRLLIINEDSIKENGIANNVSNGFIYAFICGGYFALILYLGVNYIIIKSIRENLLIFKAKKYKDNFYYKLSLIYLIYFLIRQIFENSFSLFSIDFLVTIICTFILNENVKNNFSKIN